ncbi:hypothetical protein EMPG_14326 [Blastomyces silverae]|uniref:Uncharacterized protein n=1 Tax=Blastomyces silverae TaxID=2060906 RepID=A0A0H1BH05_9EURO|nr:hypothetical protein EMPG_14326 [Blastomyces silverae]
MSFGPSSEIQHFQNDSDKNKPTDVDEVFDIEYLPPIADNYWEDQSQYELGLFAVRHMDVFPKTSSSSVSEPSDSLLKPETFNWADDVENSIQQEEEDHKNASKFFVVGSLEQSNPSGSSASLNDHIDSETLQQGSRLQDIDIHLDNTTQYLALAPAKCQMELVSSEAVEEMTRQTDLIKEYPNIHHFNWLGHAVMERSYTSPEVSLFVIVSPPKPLSSEHLMRQAVTLWQAMKFVDPILYRGCWKDLTFSGQMLFKAITGQAFQFYTPAGTWQHDTHDPDFQEPIVDPLDPHFYASETGILLNGWLSVHFARTREEYLDQADILSEPKSKERRERQPFRRSPLQQCIVADDAGDAPYNKAETSVVE